MAEERMVRAETCLCPGESGRGEAGDAPRAAWPTARDPLQRRGVGRGAEGTFKLWKLEDRSATEKRNLPFIEMTLAER